MAPSRSPRATATQPKTSKPKALRHIAFWPLQSWFVAVAIWNFADQQVQHRHQRCQTWMIAETSAWASAWRAAALGVVIYAMVSKVRRRAHGDGM